MSRSRRSKGNQWLDGFVPYQIYRITNGLDRQLRQRLRRMNISISRWRVLSVLRAYGTLSVNEITALAVMEQPNVSRTVSRLVADGLVSRRASSSDSRYLEVTLTADGRRAFERIYPAASEHQTVALAGFTAQEVETLTSLLRRMHANVFVDEGQ